MTSRRSAPRRSFGSRLVWVLGWVVVASAPLLLVMMLLGAGLQAHVRSTGEHAVAVVVDAQQGPSDWDTLVYRADGRTYREQLDTSASEGDRVEVVVDPADPTSVVLADGSLFRDLLGLWWSPVLAMALFVVGANLLLWADRPAPGSRSRSSRSPGERPVRALRAAAADPVPSGPPLYSHLTLSVFPGWLLVVMWVVFTLAPWVPKAPGVEQQVVPQLLISLAVFVLVGAVLVSPWIGLLLRVSVHPEGVFVSKWPGWFTACVPAGEVAEVVVLPHTSSSSLEAAQELARVPGSDGVYRRLSRLSTVNAKFHTRDMVLVVPSTSRPALLLDARDPRLVEALEALVADRP